jgi:hypothetical protein
MLMFKNAVAVLSRFQIPKVRLPAEVVSVVVPTLYMNPPPPLLSRFQLVKKPTV